MPHFRNGACVQDSTQGDKEKANPELDGSADIFSTEKRNVKGHWLALFKYLKYYQIEESVIKYYQREESADSFKVIPQDRINGNILTFEG